MRRLLRIMLCAGLAVVMAVSGYGIVYAKDGDASTEIDMLYAKSAVLMDADSGRVLYEKNGKDVRAMASTTKIMTCILTLENGNLDDKVMVSKNAASQPKVHLGMQAGEEFYLKDLLSSLMLESHNDSAVAIAEYIGGSVEGFAAMMNEKAESLGLRNTYFITPNGLDAADEKGAHSTTAEELARILRYCINESPMKDKFLDITRQANIQFQDVEGKRSFSCYNHNAFLSMMDGALTGKTGFTGDAGYCYIGALKRDGKTFIVALLGCGWPNNKSYKWSDTKKLMNYGLSNYNYQNVYKEINFPYLPVADGIPEKGEIGGEAYEKPVVEEGDSAGELNVLMSAKEKVDVDYRIPKKLQAPVEKGEVIGTVTYSMNGNRIKEFKVRAEKDVKKITWKWCLERLADRFMFAWIG